MNASIDFEKSIQKERLVYKGTMFQKIRLFIKSYFLGMLTLLVCLLLFMYMLFIGSLAGIFLTSLLLLLVIVSMILMNKLVKAEGTGLRKDKTEIIGLLLMRFPGILRHNCSDKFIYITNQRRAFTPDKEIVIFLEDKYVYMNMSMAIYGNVKYVFLAIPYYIKSKLVLRSFYKKIRESAQAA
jgi:hypothetical protein